MPLQTLSTCARLLHAQAAIKKLARQPTASSSPAKSQKALATENKQLATAVSDVADIHIVDAASTHAGLSPPAKAKAFWQAAAAVLEESTPIKCSSMTRQVPRQVPEAAVNMGKEKHSGQASSATDRPQGGSYCFMVLCQSAIFRMSSPLTPT